MRSRRLPFEYAVRSLGRRPLRSALGVASSVLVVLLVLSATAFVRGMRRSLEVSASPANVILLGAGSEESVERSQLDARTSAVVESALSGVEERLGIAFVSPQVHSALLVRSADSDSEGRLTVVRGVDERAFLVHPQVRIVVGRAPEPGRGEVLVGALAVKELGLTDQASSLGRSVSIGDRDWAVSGILSAPRSVMDGEIWMPISDLQIETRRDTLSCVVVTMQSPELFDEVEIFAAQRLDLELTALREDDYYAAMSSFLAPVRTMVLASAGLIALGGLLGGLNTMIAAFASRVREIGALQVLGFRRSSVAVSLQQESLLLNLTGTILAVVLGLVLLDRTSIHLSMGAFGLEVDGPVVVMAVLSGLALALVGAAMPIWRCLRLPVSQALRS